MSWIRLTRHTTRLWTACCDTRACGSKKDEQQDALDPLEQPNDKALEAKAISWAHVHICLGLVAIISAVSRSI